MACYPLYVEEKPKGIGDRIRKSRLKAGLSLEDLGEAVGIDGDTVRSWEIERTKVWREFHRDKLKLAADKMGVTVDYLLIGDTKPEGSNLTGEVRVARTGYRMVPIYGELTAGAASYTYSDVLEWEEMTDWSGNFERWGRIIQGTSMLPEFEPGDIAIFEDRRPNDGNGVHAFSAGEDTFKVLRVINGRQELWPINTDDHEPIQLVDGATWAIKGVCIRRIRKQLGGVRDVREYPYGMIWRF